MMRSLFLLACRHSHASRTVQMMAEKDSANAFAQFAKRAMSATNHFQTLGIDVSDRMGCISNILD